VGRIVGLGPVVGRVDGGKEGVEVKKRSTLSGTARASLASVAQ
jgi:hypothetical protein